MDDRELAAHLKSLCAKINLKKFTKSKRGQKKKVKKIYDPKVNHVSTFKILKQRENKVKFLIVSYFGGRFAVLFFALPLVSL
jgi:hypothetical protein